MYNVNRCLVDLKKNINLDNYDDKYIKIRFN